MKELLDNPVKLIEEIDSFSLNTIAQKIEFQTRYTGKEGIFKKLNEYFRNLPPEEKKNYGLILNKIKVHIENKLASFKIQSANFKREDITRSIETPFLGSTHILNDVAEEVIKIFGRLGFEVEEGPEVETEFYNFTALNFPENHPARDMQDTFFINSEDLDSIYILRTHTSPVQIRKMINGKPPFRFLAPGKVFRCDHDATHSPIFHQIEGLYIDELVSFQDLKETLHFFAEEFFGKDIELRFRPSFFPFTEPSAEMDIQWEFKGNRWLEILGCGMVHPQVLENCNIDSKKWKGFAFGLGVERLAMLKYNISDIRLFYEGDVRFLTPQLNH